VRWRPLVPITIFNPGGTKYRYFTKALVDTGADETVFPEDLIQILGLTPLASSGRIVWRGRTHPIRFAETLISISDGTTDCRWRPVIGFSSARIGYPILGQNGGLEFFDAKFNGNQRNVDIETNSAFGTFARGQVTG
jgi:predicted aspartyl protease